VTFTDYEIAQRARPKFRTAQWRTPIIVFAGADLQHGKPLHPTEEVLRSYFPVRCFAPDRPRGITDQETSSGAAMIAKQ